MHGLGVLVVASAMLLAGSSVQAQQTVFDFDTTGPTSTEELGNFMSFLGHDPDSWNIDPNPLLPANNNALHPRSNGTNVESFFTTVGIFNGLVGEDVVYSADISSPDNDMMGLYVRFTGNSNEPLGNTYYYVGMTTNGSTDSYRLHKVKDGVAETLASGSGPPFAAGTETSGETHKLQIEAKTVGNSVELSVSLDDQPITNMDPFVDATNPILGAGQVGIGQSTQPAYFDNVTFLNTGGNFILGDFNGDGAVDVNDFNILASNFNAPGGLSEGDLDFNGNVDAADFLEFRVIFNSQQPAGAAAVPEPSGAQIILVASLCCAVLRRRRSWLTHG